MRGMDAGPGTDLGSAGWYLGIWVTMMAAMMLPSATPMVLLFSKVSEQSSRRPRCDGAVRDGLPDRVDGVRPRCLRALPARARARPVVPRVGPRRPGVAGAAIVLAGVYQLTPLKHVCLRHCRTPLSFVMHHWHGGPLGAVRMGIVHGAWCVGCCWALMVVLFAVGVMSITWMVVVAAIVFAEKVLPVGERVAPVLAVVLIAFGVWVALAPGERPRPDPPRREQKMDLDAAAPSSGLAAVIERGSRHRR